MQRGRPRNATGNGSALPPIKAVKTNGNGGTSGFEQAFSNIDDGAAERGRLHDRVGLHRTDLVAPVF
jgi:hypothetical protein